MSLRKLASAAGVSNPYLSQIERGLRRPSADILQAIAKALRVSSQTLYVQAGILEEQPVVDVHTAILGDPTLTEKQKQVLLEVYESFRDDTGRTGTNGSHRRATRANRATAASGNGRVGGAAAATRRAGRSPAKTGGRAETQADPSLHPAPLRSSASNRRR